VKPLPLHLVEARPLFKPPGVFDLIGTHDPAGMMVIHGGLSQSGLPLRGKAKNIGRLCHGGQTLGGRAQGRREAPSGLATAGIAVLRGREFTHSRPRGDPVQGLFYNGPNGGSPLPRG
jgi:hypothetical protein